MVLLAQARNHMLLSMIFTHDNRANYCSMKLKMSESLFMNILYANAAIGEVFNFNILYVMQGLTDCNSCIFINY